MSTNKARTGHSSNININYVPRASTGSRLVDIKHTVYGYVLLTDILLKQNNYATFWTWILDK